ncbi:mediator of RNA polymerase II transcription subunit 6-like isoform X2 [Gigantopelta aegis]|uniref:mediator of RNA polymerase II transcription subunit 6-like isoform X2 n=1 Tax=Gigantopelta aegis TaxID=1735272 RepID=UPI001B88CA86|nr:mediator of RNA polymerase II transcription subunit 6-like isoform X2 [Gigantopelta aegis]
MDKCSTDQLSISWHDSAWILINQTNVLDYFSERSNPFYDNKCNNEQIKMQRLSMDQLNNMVGNEYILLHVQEPILYVIRKQYRHSPTQATPIADYYIIAGVVYQAPDLCSVINSRLLNTVHNLQSAFDEAHSFSKYHPSKGYWWDFKNQEEKEGIDECLHSQTNQKTKRRKRRKKNHRPCSRDSELICCSLNWARNTHPSL